MIRFRGIVFLFIAASFICTAGPVAAAPAPGGGGTTVTVDGSTVTISKYGSLLSARGRISTLNF